jgi:hypothetical protein
MPNGKAYTKEPSNYNEAMFQVNMKLDNIETDVGEIRSELLKLVDYTRGCREDDNKRFILLETGQTERKTKIEEHDKKFVAIDGRVDKIDTRTNVWGGGNTLMVIVAWVLALFGK